MLADVFRQEADDLFEELEAALLELEQDLTGQGLVDRAFRALHTLKGSGMMAGYESMAGFAHVLEAAFDKVRSGEQPMSKGLVDLALQSLDLLKAHLEGPLEGGAQAQETALRAALAGYRPGGAGATSAPPGPASAPPAAPVAMRHHLVHVEPCPDALREGADPLAALERLTALGPHRVEARFPALSLLDGDMDPTGCALGWTVQLSCEQDAEGVRAALGELPVSIRVEVEPQGEVFPASAPPNPALGSDRAGGPERRATPAAPKRETVKVDMEKLDVLLDLVGELVIAQSRLSEEVKRSKQPGLRNVAEDIERLSNDLRDQGMGLRMQPIGGLFQRYARLVRDLSKQLDKDLELITEGGDTEIDKAVLDRLGDCMVHLIRNAADHGVESPEARQAAGKPRRGTLRLAASHREGSVLIEITDDGKGLDRERILQRGLVKQDAQLSDEQVYTLIFEPGFSTAATVSAVSGRGVGMDVVRRSIEQLGGKVRIRSEAGKGSTFSIRLPMTLAIIDGLLVHLGGEAYVMPLDTVEECIEAPTKTETSSRQQLAEIRGELVPYLDLREWFDVPVSEGGREQVVITHQDGRRFGFVVDKVVGQHQTVLKQMGPMTQVRGLTGSTILGDGTVALVLDGPSIMAEVQGP